MAHMAFQHLHLRLVEGNHASQRLANMGPYASCCRSKLAQHVCATSNPRAHIWHHDVPCDSPTSAATSRRSSNPTNTTTRPETTVPHNNGPSRSYDQPACGSSRKLPGVGKEFHAGCDVHPLQDERNYDQFASTNRSRLAFFARPVEGGPCAVSLLAWQRGLAEEQVHSTTPQH